MAAIIAAWEQVHACLGPAGTPITLTTSKGHRFAVSIDATHVIQHLAQGPEWLRLDDEQALGVIEHQLQRGEHPLCTYLDLVDHSGSAPLRVLSRALQQVFLGMTLAHPGSCNLLFSRYVGIDDDTWPAPSLSGGRLESAVLHAKETGWPDIATLPFAQVWEWLAKTDVLNTTVATDPVHKALFALLTVCEENTSEPASILMVMQALESLLVVGHQGIRSLARSRLETILGTPRAGRRVFADLYALRCRIAHGGMPVARPGVVFDIGEDLTLEDHHSAYVRPVDDAISILTALLQDLVRADARGYEFRQLVTRVPFDAPVV
jgi:hypothetical protein